MEKFRFLTSGESHGKCLSAIIEGIPSGIEINIDFINNELKRRQQGYGRGERMQIECDSVEITSGVRFGKTLGSPISLVIKNRDFENWQKIMSIAPEDVTDEKAFSTYRPGHADYTGSIKYCHKDLRNILERSSARKTAIEVAVGAIAKILLKNLGITGYSEVTQIGSACGCENYKSEIDTVKESGDSVGGKFTVTYQNLPVGLGSHVHWDRGIDGRLAQAVMSIPAIKVVEIGTNPLGLKGSEYHDEFLIKEGKIERSTNNAGGIEGGITNGQDLIVSAIMKPIPTMLKPLNTIDSKTGKQTQSHYERSDVCAVESCAVVAEARIAWILVNEILLKYGGDSLEELKRNYTNSQSF
ncbi:chorismate synthase [bacterium]|nr:chorismate synthase [bacterium]